MSDLNMLEGDLDELLERVMERNPDFARLIGDDMSADPYGIPMIHLASIMLVYQMVKDEGYDRSWAKHGEMGVYYNVIRKTDRLDKLSKLVLAGDDTEYLRVSWIDALIDFALYCMMWVSKSVKTHPDDFRAWLEMQWCPATGISIETVEDML